jgi:hypothetical protein
MAWHRLGREITRVKEDEMTNARLIETLFPPPSLKLFRYPIDGPSEIEKAIDDAIKQVFGPEPPDSPYSEWLRKLERNGLIPLGAS